jgi:hypothetical protein
MTHEDAGKYSAKHPSGITFKEQVARMIREKSTGGEIACVTCEKISKELEVEISEVGITVDLLEIKIKKCQLGLFGYGKKPNHGKNIQAADSVSDEMKCAIEEVADNGEVTCAALWTIADQLGTKRKQVSAACETLKIKIRECQLGTF